MRENYDNRNIIKTATTDFGDYLWQPDREDISFLNLTYDRKSKQGAYMMKMQPGSETEIHNHGRREEYYIIDGDLIESDGTRLRPGDYVVYPPGTVHRSRTENGCSILAVEYSWSETNIEP